MDDGSFELKRAHLRRLFQRIDNGVWGDEPVGDGSDIPCIRAADFDFVRLRAKRESAPLRRIDSRQVARVRLSRGDIVLEKSGGGEKQVVGRAVLYDDEAPAVCSNFAARIRPDPDVEPRYLTYLLAALYYSGATATCVLQTTGIQNLDTDAWLQTDVPVLDRPKQQRIANFLDDQVARIDKILGARQRQLDLLATERASKASDAVAGRGIHGERRASGLAWTDTIPAAWGTPRICQVARIGTGHTPSRSNEEYWADCDIPWLTTGDVHRLRHDEIDSIDDTVLHISRLGLANSAAVLHSPGTVALSRTASAGFSIVMSREMATSQDYATWTCGPTLVPFYLLWCLRVMRGDLLGRLATGSTHKTIYFPDLMSIRIPLPPRQAQEAAVAEIDAFNHLSLKHAQSLRETIDLLRELKRSLITAAVTGEFDVSSADGSRVPVGAAG